MTGCCIVLATYPNSKEAEKSARLLVSKKFAACVNIIPKIQSIYRWERKVRRSVEAMVVVKTRRVLFNRIQRTIQSRHPYSCPEIILLPILRGSPSYLRWIRTSTSAVIP